MVTNEQTNSQVILVQACSWPVWEGSLLQKVVWTENKKKTSFAELENIWLEGNYNREESRIGRDGSGRVWGTMACPEIGHFFLPSFWSQLLMKMAIPIWFILKHSDIRIFRFGFGSFGLNFLHPNKPILNIQFFWWPKCAKFHVCFLYPFCCKNIILGAKQCNLMWKSKLHKKMSNW